MSRKFLGILILFCSLAAPLMANSGVLGLWKTVDDETGEVKSLVKVYDYRGKVYGRILVIFEEGEVEDTYMDPWKKAEEVDGEPYFCGLDFIWDMEERKGKYSKGKIMDPENGKVYSSEMWLDGGNLIVRGKIGPFGRNQTWLPATSRDLPSGVSEPSSLIPDIPK